jgi:hypothetical protein
MLASYTGTVAAAGSRGNSGDNEDPILATTHHLTVVDVYSKRRSATDGWIPEPSPFLQDGLCRRIKPLHQKDG